MKLSMLTTVDNKFNPFDDWDNWFAYDHYDLTNLVHQYLGMDCCELVDRYSPVSSDMAPAYAEDLNEWAIDRICEIYEPFHIFKKVSKEVA